MTDITINTGGGAPGTTDEPLAFGTFAMGLNVDGMEYGGAGAVANFDYAIPSQSELQYYKSQGLDLIRLPISWETLQTKLNGPLTASYLSNIEGVVANAASLGMKVILDLHDFGGYGGNQLGSAALPDSDFANLWTKLATAFAGNPGIAGYDLMNEPNNMPSATAWTDAAQAGITAIRTVDSTTPIVVEGNDYANSQNWVADNPGFATLHDPSNNLVFSAHLYLDTDDSGTHYDWATEAAAGDTTNIGVQRLQPFVAWLQANNLKGEIGELGVGNDNPAWLTALDNTLAYTQANNLPVTYWSAGPWLANYAYSAEPTNGVSAPQVAVLDKYSGDYPTVTQAALSGTADPNATVYLSENEVILATVQTNAEGAWSDTLTGLANGIHIIVAGENLPTDDGTIAATVFDLQAPQTAAGTDGLTASNGSEGAPITVNAGEIQTVLSGETVAQSVLAGGTEVVNSGGTATGTAIDNGGTQKVEAGATVSGSVIGGGSTEVLTSGATVSGPIEFSGSNASLSVAGPSQLDGTIVGFDANGATGDKIVMPTEKYSAGDTASLQAGNVLNVDLGGTVYAVQLDPSQSFAGEYFKMEANSLGQAVISDPKITTSPAAASPVASGTPVAVIDSHTIMAGQPTASKSGMIFLSPKSVTVDSPALWDSGKPSDMSGEIARQTLAGSSGATSRTELIGRINDSQSYAAGGPLISAQDGNHTAWLTNYARLNVHTLI